MARYQPGDVIGEYVVKDKANTGSFCEVYRAKHVETHKTCAVKVLRQNQHDDRVLRHQAAVLRELQGSPFIVKLLEDRTDVDQPHLVLEYVAETLGGWQGSRRPKQMYRVMDGILEAMQYAHEKGFVGMDLKPANVLLTRKMRPKLCDFNLVRKGGLEESLSSLPFGAAPYMAPELWSKEGAEPTVKSDIYAAGLLFYQMLTGNPPVYSSGPARKRNPHVRPRIDDIILKAAAENPDERYVSATQFVGAIRMSRIPVVIPAQTGYFSEGVNTFRNLVSFFIPRVASRR